MSHEQLLAFSTGANALVQRVLRAKRGDTTRRVPVTALQGLSTTTSQPWRAGDVVLDVVDAAHVSTAVLFSAGEAMGACAGAQRLKQLGLPLLALAHALWTDLGRRRTGAHAA